MGKQAHIALLCAIAVAAPSIVHARAPRSHGARAEFVRLNPCPATQSSRSPCPGYVIDHVVALACGGADRPDNMQWQTIAGTKEKDRWERAGCPAHRRH